MFNMQRRRSLKRLQLAAKQGKSNKKRALIGLLIALPIVLMLSLGAGTYAVFAYVDTIIPKNLTLTTPSQSSFIYDRNGKLLYEIFGDERREYVPLDQIPKTVVDATLALEDRNFYTNQGVDVRGIVRAALLNLSSDNQTGASTITQQLVRTLFLSSEKSITRKLKEIAISFRIEQIYSKDEILQAYLNQISYGEQVYGIQTAAHRFYNKDVKDLNLGEITALVGIPQTPTYNSFFSGAFRDLQNDLYVDVNHPGSWLQEQYLKFSKVVNGRHVIDRWRQRQIKTLSSMMEVGKITQKQADDALLVPINPSHPNTQVQAPHFVFYVRDLLFAKYGEEKVRTGGFKIYTTLDLDLQSQAQTIITNTINKIAKPFNAHNAAMMAVNPTNGQILAYVGSVNYFDTANDGNVDVVSSTNRQPGSSFKPFVYATDLMKGLNTQSLFMDVQTDFGGGYIPRNYDGKFHGPQPMRIALANSFNIPAIKATAIAGVPNVIATAKSMGVDSLQENGDYGLSLGLGAAQIKLFDMLQGYSTFANLGNKIPFNPILKITDASGKLIEEFQQPAPKQAIDPGVAYMISDILSDNQARVMEFGYNTPLRLSRKAAVKTGTTNDIKDNWTIGFTPNLAAAVWVGNNNGDALLGGASGVTGAAPIWHDFMEAAFKTTPNVPWYTMPDSVTTIPVDNFSGMKPGEFTGDQTSNALILKSFVSSLPQDDIRKQITLDSSNGLLANMATPLPLQITKTFFALHPEIPTTDPAYPRWQAALTGWAQQQKRNDPNTPFVLPTDTSQSYYNNDNTPTVVFKTPTDGAMLAANNFNVEVSALGPYPMTTVDFYLGANLIGSTAGQQASYSKAFTALDGKYSITVRATDQKGAIGSATINVTIDTQLSVAITTPAGNATVGGQFKVAVAVAAPASPVKTVSFALDGVVQATVTASPYESVITAGSEGLHTVEVVATDQNGKTATDSITVTSDTSPPTAFDLSSGICTTVNQICLITASPMDAISGISHLEFYLISPTNASPSLVQDSPTVPTLYNFKPGQAGNYSLYAIAYDHAGNKRQSGTLTATITP